MLTEFRFSNFKSFRKNQLLPLRPITLIFGLNSAGKSSILQLLRLVRASVQEDLPFLPYDHPSIGLVSHRHVTHRMNGGPISVTFSTKSNRNQSESLSVSAEFQPEISRIDIKSERIFPSGGAVLHPLVFVGEEIAEAFGIELVPNDLFEFEVMDGREVRMALSESDTMAGLCEKYRWIDPTGQESDSVAKWFEEVRREARELRLVRGHSHSSVIDLASICEDRLAAELDSSDRKSIPSVLAGLIHKNGLRMAYSVGSPANIRELGLIGPHGQNLKPVLSGDLGAILRRHAYRTEIAQAVWAESIEAITGVFLRYFNRVFLNSDSDSRRSVIALNDVRRQLSAVKYLGPVRDVPSRFAFDHSGTTSLNLQSSSDNIVSKLVETPEAVEFINESFNQLEIRYRVELGHLRNDSVAWLDNTQTLFLRDPAGTPVSLEDVGFGVGQVLPILLEAQMGGCLLIEQPELHLHPALQGNLAETLVKAVERTRGQVILETHSEHMVLRIQKLIRLGRLSADEVSVLVIESAPDGHQESHSFASSIRRLDMDDSGRLVDPWPPGFFDGALEEFDLEL